MMNDIQAEQERRAERLYAMELMSILSVLHSIELLLADAYADKTTTRYNLSIAGQDTELVKQMNEIVSAFCNGAITSNYNKGEPHE